MQGEKLSLRPWLVLPDSDMGPNQHILQAFGDVKAKPRWLASFPSALGRAGRQGAGLPLMILAQIRQLFQGLPRPPCHFPAGGRSLAERLPEDDATTQAMDFGLLSLAGGQAESRSKGTKEAPSVGLRCSQVKARNRTRDLLVPLLCHRCFPRFRSSVFRGVSDLLFLTSPF